MKNIHVFLVFLIVFTSCEEEVKSLSFESEEITIKSEAEINVLLTRATNNSDLANKINRTINNEIVKSISNSKDNLSLDKALLAFDKSYVEFKTNFDENDQDWTLDIESELTYQSSEIITIALSIYSDTGGAHGNDRISFLNFDPNTGELLSDDEIITDIEAFKSLAKSYFKKSVDLENVTIEEVFFDESFKLPENIGFTEDGLVLLYNIYEIASYNQGYTEFVIPFKAAQPYLKVN